MQTKHSPSANKTTKKVLQERLLNELNNETEGEEELANEYETKRMANIAQNNLVLEQQGIGEQV